MSHNETYSECLFTNSVWEWLVTTSNEGLAFIVKPDDTHTHTVYNPFTFVGVAHRKPYLTVSISVRITPSRIRNTRLQSNWLRTYTFAIASAIHTRIYSYVKYFSARLIGDVGGPNRTHLKNFAYNENNDCIRTHTLTHVQTHTHTFIQGKSRQMNESQNPEEKKRPKNTIFVLGKLRVWSVGSITM